MTAGKPLHHIFRVRSRPDLVYVRDGLADEIMIGANFLESDAQSVTTAVRQTDLDVSVDPVLWRLQEDALARNEAGELKDNYRRLADSYLQETGIDLASGTLMELARGKETWRTIARNVIDHQRSRLSAEHDQLNLLAAGLPRELHAARLVAPGLISHSATEDAINKVLWQAAAESTSTPVAIPVMIPLARLRSELEIELVLQALPSDGVGSYLLWMPGVTEELLGRSDQLSSNVLRLVAKLAGRGISVGHFHAGYWLTAFHELGIGAVANTTSWTDLGEPIPTLSGGGQRSCRTYVPGLRACLPFDQAHWIGRALTQADYLERYCDCGFCAGAFREGMHPLDRLLAEEETSGQDGTRRKPTREAVALNTWHYLLSRRAESQAFSHAPALQVVSRDKERAALLSSQHAGERLARLADMLNVA